MWASGSAAFSEQAVGLYLKGHQAVTHRHLAIRVLTKPVGIRTPRRSIPDLG